MKMNIFKFSKQMHDTINQSYDQEIVDHLIEVANVSFICNKFLIALGFDFIRLFCDSAKEFDFSFT